MAHFDKESGSIILSHEEEKLFKECSTNTQEHRTPIADRIMKKILPKNLRQK